VGIVDGHVFAHRLGTGKIFFGHVFADDQRAWSVEGGRRITLEQRKSKHLENLRIDGDHPALKKGVLPVADKQVARSGSPGCFLDFRDLRLHGRSQGKRRDIDVKFSLPGRLVLFDPVKGPGAGMETVEAQFVLNP
jgi:hypothetical protein